MFIPERVDSTFRYILVAARRAEQLIRGARPRVVAGGSKPSRVAMREVSEELIEWDYGPAPAAPQLLHDESEAAIEASV